MLADHQASPEMAPILDAARALLDRGIPLASGLEQVIRDGIVIESGLMVFRSRLPLLRNDAVMEFDSTERESWANKVHLDDSVDMDSDAWAEACVAQGILLSAAVFEQAPFSSLPVEAYVSVDLGNSTPGLESFPSATFRFFCRRPSESYFPEDVSTYPGPLLRICGRTLLEA